MVSPTSIAQIDTWRALPKETPRLEFKEAKQQFDQDKLYRYCVALANEGGGQLVLGVSDKPPRKVVGTAAFQDTNGIEEQVFQKVGFRVEAESVSHPDGRIVIVHIPSRPRGAAYHFEGAYLMRAGEQLVPMSEDRLRTIFAEGRPDWLSEAALADCDDDRVVQLLDTQSYFDLMELPYPVNRAGVLQRFESERLIEKSGTHWIITNLGAVLFAKKLDEFPSGVSRKAARVIVYDGTSKMQTKLDKPGSKGYAVGFTGMLEFIGGQIPANEVIGQALRKEVKMFPDIAVRELVANALIHQDFTETGTSVMIEIYSDRMEISNPGKPFIPADRFIDEYQSRNERLADLMRRLHICEEKGSGVDKVIEAAEVFQLPPPDFRVSDRRTAVVLFGHKEFDQMDRNERIRACYQHCCLSYVTNRKMTNQTLRERFKLSEAKTAVVSQVIGATVDAGKIKVADPEATSTRYRNYLPFWA